MDPLNERQRHQIRQDLSVGAETFAVLILAAAVIAGVALAMPGCRTDRDSCSLLTALDRPAVTPTNASASLVSSSLASSFGSRRAETGDWRRGYP